MKTKKVAYISDDYTEKGVLEENEVNPRVEFIFKPLNFIQSANMTDEVIGSKGSAEVGIKLIGKHVVSWDIAKPDGSIVNPKDAADVRRIAPEVLNKILSAIRGDTYNLVDDAKAAETVGNL